MFITWALFIALGGGLTAAVTLYFWNHIIYFFQNIVLPWISKILGDSVGDVLSRLVCYLDDLVVLSRRQIKACWNWLKTTLFRSTTKYTQTGLDSFNEESVVETYDGKIHVETKTVRWNDLPKAVITFFTQNAQKEVVVDNKEVLVGKFKERVLSDMKDIPSLDREIRNDPDLKDLLDSSVSIAN